MVAHAGRRLPHPHQTSAGAGERQGAASAPLADIPAGAGKVVPVDGKPAIVINTDQGVTAYLGDLHAPRLRRRLERHGRAIQCPCHDGRFNPATGTVVSGPPPAPLPA